MGMFGKENESTNSSSSSSSSSQPQNTYDPFDSVGNSDGRTGGVYPLAGLYPVLYVDSLKMIKTRKREDAFVAEFDILKSDVPERPAGTRFSWVVNFKFESAPANVKSFLAAVMNCDVKEVDAEGSRYACSDKNPCHGRLVRLEASMIKTKQDKDFTLCNWHPVPDEMQGKAEEMRKEAGFV
jgi:hypothetical protein